jgi:hypothetical protein
MAMPRVPQPLQSMQDKQAWFCHAANWLFAIEGGFTQTWADTSVAGGRRQFYLLWPVVVYLASERTLLLSAWHCW